MGLLRGILGEGFEGRPFVALVSPSIRRHYGERHSSINGFLKGLGALSVHPVDAGIEEFVKKSASLIQSGGGGVSILSACPAARPFIIQRFPAFAGRVLSLPSPMALRAKAALRERGIEENGFALAISPCEYKKMEQDRHKPEILVVRLNDFLKAARAEGLDVLSSAGSAYDDATPPIELACRIGQEVARELGSRGVPARAESLEGEEEVIRFFGSLDPEKALAPGSAVTVAEVNFCKGGCAVEVDG
jgi:iron only hydrogenase large subunit-like protein